MNFCIGSKQHLKMVWNAIRIGLLQMSIGLDTLATHIRSQSFFWVTHSTKHTVTSSASERLRRSLAATSSTEWRQRREQQSMESHWNELSAPWFDSVIVWRARLLIMLLCWCMCWKSVQSYSLLHHYHCKTCRYVTYAWIQKSDLMTWK